MHGHRYGACSQSRWRMQLHLRSRDFHDPLRWAGAFERTHTRRLFPRTHGGGCLEIQTPRCNPSLSSGPACYHPHRGAVVWTASGGRTRRIRCELLLSREILRTQNTQKQKLGRAWGTQPVQYGKPVHVSRFIFFLHVLLPSRSTG